MPSTTPDLRIATVRGLGGSESGRLTTDGKVSRGIVSAFPSSFTSVVGSPAGGVLAAGFGSAGHMASNFGAGGRRVCGGTPKGGATGERADSAPADDGADDGAPAGCSASAMSSSMLSGASGLGSFGAANCDERSSPEG